MSDPWDSALRAFVQDDNGKPLANLLREVQYDQGQIPHRVVAGLAELLDPTTPRNRYRFVVEPLPVMSNMSLFAAIDEERKRWFESKEAIEWRCARAAADVERTRLTREARERLGESLGQDMASIKAFAEERREKQALQAFAREELAEAKLQDKRTLSYAAIRLTTKRLTKEECKRVERRLEIIGDVWMATERGLSASDAKIEAADKFKLSTRQIDNILKMAPPGPWRDRR